MTCFILTRNQSILKAFAHILDARAYLKELLYNDFLEGWSMADCSPDHDYYKATKGDKENIYSIETSIFDNGNESAA